MDTHQIDLSKAFNATSAEEFLREAFPPKWASLAARILESGAEFSETMDANGFAPGWSMVPKTVRYSKTGNVRETWFKSMIFRVHDFIHQLWGLPVPTDFATGVTRSCFKRMWMCSEMAVLAVVEFFYCQWLYDTQPHLREFLTARNTLLFKNTTELRDKTLVQTAVRLDGLLHKGQQPGWVTENRHGIAFICDFGAMLAYDRVNIDYNWTLLKNQPDSSYLAHLPNQSYSPQLDGVELTCWMIAYFELLQDTSPHIDRGLQQFNQQRRRLVRLPAGWNNAPTGLGAPQHTPAYAQ